MTGIREIIDKGPTSMIMKKVFPETRIFDSETVSLKTIMGDAVFILYIFIIRSH